MSPALGLLDYVWLNLSYTSHRVANEAMQVALTLAIESGMEWAEGDCRAIEEKYRPQYWLGQSGWEPPYARACDGPHGPNPSAIKAIEAHLGRKPFLVVRSCGEKAKVRLHVGARFDWHEDMKRRVPVKVTSFGTKKIKGKDGKETEVPCVVACSYETIKKGSAGHEWESEKVAAIFRISHDDIAAYHKAIRDHEKAEKAGKAAESAA